MVSIHPELLQSSEVHVFKEFMYSNKLFLQCYFGKGNLMVQPFKKMDKLGLKARTLDYFLIASCSVT